MVVYSRVVVDIGNAVAVYLQRPVGPELEIEDHIACGQYEQKQQKQKPCFYPCFFNVWYLHSSEASKIIEIDRTYKKKNRP